MGREISSPIPIVEIGQTLSGPERSEHPESSVEDGELLAETYFGSDVLKKKGKQSGRPFTAGFSDIDNTFFRQDRTEAAKKLYDDAEQRDIPGISVTGNSYEAILNRIKSGELPYFDIIAGAVGTEIWVLHQGDDGEKYYIEDKEYKKLLIQSGFSRRELIEPAHRLIEEINQILPDSNLNFQEPENEARYLEGGETAAQQFKISYHFFASSEDELSQIATTTGNFFPDQQIIVCEEINYNSRMTEGDNRKKYNLDILPVTKAGAVNYLVKLLGVERGIVAGDSGNDTDMLINSGRLEAVLVGGAKTEAIDATGQATVRERKGSFRIIKDREGNAKACYIERKNDRLGPESIARAVSIFKRALRWKEHQKSQLGKEENVPKN